MGLIGNCVGFKGLISRPIHFGTGQGSPGSPLINDDHGQTATGWSVACFQKYIPTISVQSFNLSEDRTNFETSHSHLTFSKLKWCYEKMNSCSQYEEEVYVFVLLGESLFHLFLVMANMGPSNAFGPRQRGPLLHCVRISTLSFAPAVLMCNCDVQLAHKLAIPTLRKFTFLSANACMSPWERWKCQEGTKRILTSKSKCGPRLRVGLQYCFRQQQLYLCHKQMTN